MLDGGCGAVECCVRVVVCVSAVGVIGSVVKLSGEVCVGFTVAVDNIATECGNELVDVVATVVTNDERGVVLACTAVVAGVVNGDVKNTCVSEPVGAVDGAVVVE